MRYVFFGNGFITKSIIKHYDDKSHIVVYSKTSSDSPYLVVEFDIRKTDSVNFNFSNDDILVYSMALKTPGSSYSLSEIEDELVSLTRFIDISIDNNVSRAVLISSASVYGFGEEPFKEESPYNPQSSYAKLKVEMERLFNEKMQSSTLPFNILRISNVYGSIRSRQGIINLLLYSIKDDNKIKINNAGLDTRDFIDDKYLSFMFFRLFESNPSRVVYNLSSSMGVKVIDIVNSIISIDSNFKNHIEILSHQHTSTKSVLDNSLINSEIGNSTIMCLRSSLIGVIDEIN